MIADARTRTGVVAALVFLATLAIDVPLLPSGVSIGDQAEAQTVPYLLGIMHPTGFPLFTLAGWAWSHALPIGTVAWRMNAFSALCTAAMAAGVVLLAAALESTLAAAAFAALAFAFGATVWAGAIAVNGQELSAACSVFALGAAVRYARGGPAGALVAACALCGCGIAAHPSSIWIVPAIAAALWCRREGIAVRLLAAAFAALVLPLLCYAYVPLRGAAVAPPGVAALGGAPPVDPRSLDWEGTPPNSRTGVIDKVLGRNEHAGEAVLRAFDPRAYPAAALAWARIAREQYGLVLPLLALAGAAVLAWRDRREFGVLTAGTLGGLLFAYAYRDDAHIDRYYLLAFAVTAALAAALTRALPAARFARPAAAALLALLAALALAGNRPDPQPRYLDDGEAVIAAVRRDLPDNAIVIAQWNEANALRYGAFVEGVLGGRTIVAGWPGSFEDRYPVWMRTRPLFFYVSPLGRRSLFPWAWRIEDWPSSRTPFLVLRVLAHSTRPSDWRSPRRRATTNRPAGGRRPN
jgi:hypothetical protein